NMPAASAVTVHYATVDGTAVAGTDYTATSGVLTFPAGTTTQTIQVVTTATPLHQPSKTFTVALDTPTPASTVIGPRGVTTVTITNHNPVPSNGAVQTLDDFENAGSVGALFTFSGDAGSTPTLTQVAAARPGAPAGNNALSVAYTVTSYGGFGHDLTTAQDWTSYDGFSFWVKGTNTGQTVEYEVKAGGTSAANAQLWQGFFTDNIAGWQKVQIPFASLKKRTDYQPGGAPNNPTPDLTAMWGYAVNLPGGGASNTLLFDDVQVYQNLQVIQDFEGANPITDPGGAMANTGVFAWGGNATSTPALSIVQLDRPGVVNNHALQGTWADNNSYGGISYDLATSAPQDWSSFAGIEFWFYGHNPTPNPVPGSGQSYEFEVKDGGVDGEHAELWQTFITDDWQGWHLVQIPFSSLKLRTDYQPTGGPINSTLDLNKMYGFALTEPSGSTNGQFDVDQFAVYGVNTGATTAHITTAADVYTVDAGGTATVGVKLTTNSDKPLDHDVTVQWSLGSGSAVAGTDYTDATGTVTFTTGMASGTVQTFTVQTLPNTTASMAKQIPIQLTATGADVTADKPVVVINAHGLPYLDKTLSAEKRVKDLLSRMSVDEKIGQMTQAERGALAHSSDITTSALGSLLSGGGSTPTPNTPQAWADMIDAFQARAQATPLQIPLIYGEDSVHGNNNLVGATVFPHNIGLGATRDPALVQTDGAITAEETRATGVTWAFSPCVCVTRDERWGRSYESFGEDPALVDQMQTIIDGLQGNGALSKNTSVLATAKHFVGDGGTAFGSSTSSSYTIDQGVTTVTQPQLDALYLEPFKQAVQKHNVGSVMPSYSSLQIVGKDTAPIKMHARGDMITGVLKQQFGFKGFVISDWQGINQIGPDYQTDVKIGVNAGIDMVMVPDQYVTFEKDLKNLVTAGDVTMARIDDAVSRILLQKFKLGLFEQPYADRTNIGSIGNAAHRAVARTLAAESQVLLKNTGNVLPLAANANVYVAGSNANNIGNQVGGWTVTWQGSSSSPAVGTTILAGLQQVAPGATFTYSANASAPIGNATVGVVVVGETPYAEGAGDVGNGHTLDLSAADKAAVDTVCAAVKCIVLVVSGRPMNIAPIQAEANAIIASWLPGSEGAGVADVLVGNAPFTGRLPVSWAKNVDTTTSPVNVGDASYDPLYAYGWGLRTDSPKARLQAARDALAAGADGADGKRAVPTLTALLQGDFWNSDGTLRRVIPAFALLTQAAKNLGGVSVGAAMQAGAIVSLVRDVAQKAIVNAGASGMAKTASLTADAEHALLLGNPTTAIALLDRAYRQVI
ncbi:MAG: beta-glucosidase, partial [Frankiaceae bacterium]|nr:beta-glucosidase [Frankiaceae bacterium]